MKKKEENQAKSRIRKPRPIDWEKISRLFEAGANIVQVAAKMQIDRQYLYRRCEEDNGMHLSDFMRNSRDTGDTLIKVAMFKKAMTGDNTMLVWLSKNRLGYRDKQDVTSDGKSLAQMKIEVIDKKAGEAMQTLISNLTNNEADDSTYEER